MAKRSCDFRTSEEQFVNLGKHRINTEGQIFTIIGRETGSAAIVSAELIRENTNSLFFGEGVSDTLDMYYDNPAIDLPNSKLGFVLGYGPHVFPNTDE